ncbi:MULTISPECIES: hypothetical protein [unclassified Yoonia]|nr:MULTISPECIES: hypothetical protein [unclassified Yoonia]
MTNGIAIFLLVLIGAALAYDGLANDWRAFLFTMRKFVDLIEYLAFWR